MIKSRQLGLAFALLLVASACSNSQLGRAIPDCDGDPNASMIIQIQSVPSDEYVPCINELKPGWEYVDLVPKFGDSRFWISSDRLGDRFLEVILTDGCDVDSSLEGVEIMPGVLQYRSVTMVRTTALVVIAPTSVREVSYAERVGGLLESEVEDRRVFVSYDLRDVALAEKIAAAHESGQPLVAIEERDARNDPSTAGLALPGESAMRTGVELDELISRLESHLGKPSYKGDWVNVLDGGCITHRFYAEGPEIGGLVQSVTDAVGLFPSREVQQQLREAGEFG